MKRKNDPEEGKLDKLHPPKKSDIKSDDEKNTVDDENTVDKVFPSAVELINDIFGENNSFKADDNNTDNEESSEVDSSEVDSSEVESSDEEMSDDGYDTSNTWYKDQDLFLLLKMFVCFKSSPHEVKIVIDNNIFYVYIGDSIVYIIEYIGNGAFGTVLKFSDANGTAISALKIGVPEEIDKESSTIRQLHANGLLNGVINMSSNPCKYGKYALMELPYYASDLHNYMKKNKNGLMPAVAKSMFKQILEGLYNIHYKAGLVHGDLKLKNILINPSNLDCVIIDFGNSFPISDPSKARMCLDECTSPEMTCGVGTPASDMWSIACILYKLVTGKYPYINKFNIQHSLAEITQKLRSLPKEHNIDNLIDFISKCILIVPGSRMTAKTALSHPYVQ